MTYTESNYDDVKKHAGMLTSFLHKYQYLIDSYVLDYFTENSWAKLPSSWQHVLEKLEFADISSLLDFQHILILKEVLPLSLLAFRATASSLALSRKPIDSTESINSFLQKVQDVTSNNLGKIKWENSDYDLKSICQNKSLAAVFRKHVKPKKQHEIFRLSQLVSIVLHEIGIDHVVDIGSGLGHLSRLLSLQYNLKVATIDAVSKHTSTAVSFDKQAVLSLSKVDNMTTKSEKHVDSNKEEKLCEPPHHLESMVTVNSSKKVLKKVLHQAWPGLADKTPLSLIGLHTCGDLAPTLLKLFVEMPQVQAVFSVGCCYMKLNENIECDGYPMSCYVKSTANYALSYEARELSCHALENYIKKLQGNCSSLKIHCYRAVLEKIIQDQHPTMRHLGLRSVKNAENMVFLEYAMKALSRSSLDISMEALQSPVNNICLNDWKKVVIIYSLRLMTAPAIESLILTDRMLYLLENGIASCILPVFDPFVSPRNFVLLGMKKTCKFGT